jgi:hypothetical protein
MSALRVSFKQKPINLAGRLISFQIIMKDPLPPIDWLVESLFPHGERTLLYGEWGSMKSWLLLHLGLHIAAGKPWLGKFSIQQARSVLYLDEEMSERNLRRRIKQLGSGAGLNAQALPFRAVSHLNARFSEGCVEEFLKGLKAEGFDPDVIIVETLRRVLVGNENEAEDVSAFWHNVSPILSAGKSLIISHHMRKPSAMGYDPSRNRASGSTDIMAGADNAFSVARKHGGDAITIECEKSRTAEEPTPFVVSLCDREGEGSPVEMGYEGSTEQHEESVRKEPRAIKLVGDYFSSHHDVDVQTCDVVAALKSEGVSERTAQRALEKASRCGMVDKVCRGVWRATKQSKAA